MEEREIKRRLGELDLEDRQILYWKCYGLSNKQIAEQKIKDVKSGGTIHDRLLWIRGHLGTKEPLREHSICELYLNAVGDPPVFEPWPPEQLVVPSTPIQAEETQGQGPLTAEEETRREEQERPRWVVWLARLIIVGALVYLVFLILGSLPDSRNCEK